MGQVLCAPGFPPDLALRAIRAHRDVLAGEDAGALYKRAVKSKVTRVDLPEGGRTLSLCVKEFIRPPMLRWFPLRLRHRPALRSWAAAFELERRGIPAPRRLAGPLEQGRDHGVDPGVEPLDALDGRLHQFLRLDLPVPDQRRLGGGVHESEIVCASHLQPLSTRSG